MLSSIDITNTFQYVKWKHMGKLLLLDNIPIIKLVNPYERFLGVSSTL